MEKEERDACTEKSVELEKLFRAVAHVRLLVVKRRTLLVKK